MLILSDDFPASVSPGNGAIALVMEPEDNGAFFVFDPTTDPILETTGSAVIPPYTGDVIIIPISDVGAVVEVTIGGEVYTAQESDSEPGFFHNAGSLIIKLKAGHTPVVGGAIAYTALASTYGIGKPSTSVPGPHPGFLYAINATGSFNLRFDLESEPSGSIEVFAPRSQESYYRSALANGTKLVLYGKGFSIESLTITRLAGQPYIRIGASLTGYWSEELDERIVSQDAIEDEAGDNGIPGSDSSEADGETATDAETCKAGWATAASMGRLVGTKVKGLPIRIYPTDAPTTLRQILSGDRPHAEGGYVDLTSPDGIEVRPWTSGGSRHFISPAQIIGNIGIAISGAGSRVYGTGGADGSEPQYIDDPGVALAQEFEGDEWIPDQEESVDEDVGEDIERRFVSGDRLPSSPITVREPRDASHAFDNGGKVKERTVVVKFNNQTITEEGETYGYAYAKSDLYDYSVSPLLGGGEQIQAIPKSSLDFTFRGFWQKVKEWKTSYEFDSEGYLIRVQTKGWELTRFENDQDGSSLKLTLDYTLSDDFEERDRLLKEINLRTQFHKRLIDDTTDWRLQTMVGLYPDIKRPETEEELSTWVEPRFALEMLRTDKGRLSTPDPRSDDERKLPDIETGRDYQESQSIEIIYPQTGEASYNPRRDYFRENQSIENQEGAGLRYGAVDRSCTEREGRPGVHTRLERSKDRCPRQRKRTDTNTGKFIFNTAGNFATRNGEQVSYAGVTDPTKALQAAITESSIENTESAEVWTLAVLPTSFIYPGDFVHLDRYVFRVLSVEYPRSVVGAGKIQSDGWRLRLGRFIMPRITLTRA